MPKLYLALMISLMLAACRQAPPPTAADKDRTIEIASPEEGGAISANFIALLQRVVVVADELKIGKRVLDLNSVGGMVEDAIKAGDAIAGSHWTLWVREGSVCHSACVLVLASGDMRMIRGRVGIHRIIRTGSTASCACSAPTSCSGTGWTGSTRCRTTWTGCA